MEPKQTYIAYRCPSCASTVYGLVGNFTLAADMLKCKCPCQNSALSIKPAAGNKVRITVPCLFCGKDHSYVIAQSLLSGQNCFSLNCAYSNLDICFIGDKEQIDRTVAAGNAALQQLFDEAGIPFGDVPEEAGEQDEERPCDAQIYDIVRFVVKELEADGKVDCPCHGGTYELEILPEGIRIFCPSCNACYLFTSNSVAAAQDFLQCDHLTLQ